MGLRNVVLVALLVMVGCVGRKTVVHGKVKIYIDCCDPSVAGEDKDICRWAADKGISQTVYKARAYSLIWSDCEPKSEPWRKWE